ncbi:AMP-binding protein [Cryptosporangium arvum]|uniref:AMP-binding protein n=1 Tax=Cryptosporangium arvum TaxID=80871 RepID=UPI0004B184B8|nr:AMP-binding protein [Cryptosporangium arvum]
MLTVDTVPDLLRGAAARFGPATAIADGAERVSHVDLLERVRAAGRAYLAAGVRPGDRIAVWARNRPEFVVALLGAEYVGVAVVPLNTRFRGHEAAHILRRSRAVALVVDDGFLATDYLGMLRAAAAEPSPAGGEQAPPAGGEHPPPASAEHPPPAESRPAGARDPAAVAAGAVAARAAGAGAAAARTARAASAGVAGGGDSPVDAAPASAAADVPGEVGERLPVPGLPHLRVVVELGSEVPDGAVGWEDFLAAGNTVPAADVEAAADGVTPETVCDVLFTSGTTGVPKGVMSSHRQTLSVAAVWARGAGLSPDDRYAIVNPFFHSFGYKAGIVAAITGGATIHPVPVFDPGAVLSLIERERITVLPGAPTIFTTLINHPDRESYDLSSLRFSIAGAASVPENLFPNMREILGFDQVAQAYGLTECVVATQSRPGEDLAHIAETTGPAVPGLEIRIVAPDGTEAPTGADGEIRIRGANVMLGYFEDPGATSAAIDPDGWLHTGDQGRKDEHGCVTITGRIKDMYIVGGFNVYPAEVENVLAAHPDVMEAAVVGVPDARLGAVGRAYVIARPGTAPAAEALVAFCRERIANFKVPSEVVFLAELPRNAGGKVLKRVLAGEDTP